MGLKQRLERLEANAPEDEAEQASFTWTLVGVSALILWSGGKA